MNIVKLAIHIFGLHELWLVIRGLILVLIFLGIIVVDLTVLDLLERSRNMALDGPSGPFSQRQRSLICKNLFWVKEISLLQRNDVSLYFRDL